eukprot:1186711-Prorocentrum_minimum.AAC.1
MDNASYPFKSYSYIRPTFKGKVTVVAHYLRVACGGQVGAVDALLRRPQTPLGGYPRSPSSTGVTARSVREDGPSSPSGAEHSGVAHSSPEKEECAPEVASGEPSMLVGFEGTPEENAAATKIQAVYHGKSARNKFESMKAEASKATEVTTIAEVGEEGDRKEEGTAA